MTEGTALGDYLSNQQNNPAAPAGAQQMASQAGSGTKLGAWLTGEGAGGHGEQGYTGGAQSWLTGANQEGTNNGWDNQFVDTFYSEWGKALEEGTARNYFERDDATGVVTWDHTGESGRSYTFGDVYEKGKYKGNLYEDYDKNTANLMMTPWLLDDDTQAQTFSASDRMERLDREIQAVREDRNSNFEDSLKALEFEGDVQAREKAFREGFVDEGIVAGGILGGAALGAGVGSVAPGVGTIGGGILGGALGGIGAILNRDSLTEQAARAYEVTSLSYDEHGLSGGVSTGVHQWAGFGGRMIAPASNITQGLYDAAAGTTGDGESEFYRVDEEGQNQAPKWMRALDVGATLADSLLQFSNPMGVGLYSAQMTGVVGGQVAELAGTGGETFDARSGSFDSIFTDDDGNFDASAAAAGIGKIGIDAVQLGFARGLAGRANALRADVGQGAAYGTLGQRVSDKLPLWMGGSKGLAAGEERVRAAGFSFTRGADGAIVEGSRRATLGLLAPSEQLSALSARVVGIRQAALRDGAYSADDFYRAAGALASGERKVTTAIVNGFGEGYEEAVQAVLEPHSHGGSVSAEEVLQSAIYGAAAGAGMTAGAGLRTPSGEDRMYGLAATAYNMRTGGGTLSRQEYDAMPKVERRRLAAMSEAERSTAEAAFAKITHDMQAEQAAGVAGIDKVNDAVASAVSQAAAKATNRTDGSFVITQLESAPKLDEQGNLLYGEIPVDAAAASAQQTAVNLNNHMRGLVIGRATLAQRLQEAQAAVEADPTDTDAQADLAARTRQLEMADLTLEWGTRVDQLIDAAMQRIDQSTTIPELEANVAELNEFLRKAFHRQLDTGLGQVMTEDDKTALARTVSMVFVRDPQDQSGSFQVLLPQVSARLTAARSDNVVEISHAILPAISGDYDGDKIRQQAQLLFDDTEFATARSGGHFIGAGSSVNVGAPKYEPVIVEYLAESLAGGNITLQAFARQTLNSIGTAVRNRYDGIIEGQVLDEVLGQFYSAVEANDKDARATLMDGLATLAGGEMTGFGRDRLSNEWLWIDQLIVSTFQRFQESYAAHRPDTGPEVYSGPVTPVHQSTDVRTVKAERSATYGQTLARFAVGDSLFRKFQKLHYSAINSPVLSAEGISPSTLTEMVQLYRELGQLVTKSDLEVVRSKDNITGHVLAQLDKLAEDFTRLHPSLNKHQSMLVVANLRVQNLDFAENGDVTIDGSVSLAQMLLKQAVIEDQRANARVLEGNTELQARHARLLQMTKPESTGGKNSNPHGAEEAFVEVFGSQQLYTLLGDDAGIFGPHLTLEQFVRQFSSMHELDRRSMRQSLMSEAPYLGRAQETNMPYDLSEVDSISPYRSVVDALLKVGAGRVTMDQKTGKLSGEMARRSDRVGENFREAHTQVRQALRQYLNLSPRNEGELTVGVVQRLLEGNPDFARSVMDLVPDAAANAAFVVRDGEVYAANWLYEMFVEPDAKKAEMHYWRNLLRTQWFAKGDKAMAEELEEGEHARQYHRLERRMHRIMYRLAAQEDGGLAYQQFISKLEQASDLEEFIRWVNTAPGVRGDQAPIVAWVDDVVEFDADKAQGGWTTALAGAELRESIATLRQRAESLVSTLTAEKAAMAKDAPTRAAIRRVIKKDAGDPNVVLSEGDRAKYDRFVKAIDFAAEWRSAAGPQAMIYQTVGAVQGFYAQAHTKGKNPANVAPLGQLDAMRDAFDYVTNYERGMSALTSVNLDAVGSNLSQVARDSGRTMDDYGRPVEWSKPTPAQMLDLLEDPDTRPFARGMLFPQVMERDANGVMRPQLLLGRSLSDLLRGVNHKDMFPRNGSLSHEAAFKYLSMVEGVARKYNGHFSVQRAVNDLVIARTSNADHALSVGEIESMTVQAYYEVAQVLQAVGSLAAQPHDPGTDPLGEMLDEVRKAQRRVRTARTLGVEVKDGEQITDLILDTFIQEREKEMLDEITGLAAQGAADPDNADFYTAQQEAAQADFDMFRTRVELLRSDDVAGQVVSMFSLEGDPTEVAAKKQAITEYILANMRMIELSSASRVTLNKLTQQMLDSARNGQPDLSDKEWGELSRAVIGVYLDKVANQVPSGASVSPWPDADRVQDQKYFDTTWAYLVEDLVRADGPLAQAAAEVAASNYGTPVEKDDFINLLDRTIFDTKRLGPWTGDIPRASIEANSRIDSAAAEAAIAMAGNSPKRQAAIMAALRRTFLKPDDSLLSTTRLSWTDLNRDLFDEVEVQLPGLPTPVRRPLAQLNNRFAKSATFEVVDAEGVTQTYDLMTMAGVVWNGDTKVRDSGYQEIHLDRLKSAVDKIAGRHGVNPAVGFVNIEFFHPDSQPETVAGGPNWHNNVYFEGTSFKLDADTYESLTASLWFSPNGLSQMAQRAALDASKTGKPALQMVDAVTAAERKQIEADWVNDMGAMLREKTRRMLETNDVLGTERLDPEFYNAVYKDMKARHFVRGNIEGEPVLWTSEQVIAFQLANPGQVLPIADAQLWVPSDDVLRSLLGEQGGQGVTRVSSEQLELDPSRVKIYRGVTPQMMERFAEGVVSPPVTLAETRVVNRGRESALTVRTMLDQKERSAFDERMRYFAQLQQQIGLDRGEAQRSDDLGFNAKKNLRKARKAGKDMLTAENLSIHWGNMGLPFGVRTLEETEISKAVLRQRAAAMESDDFRTGWIYREGSKGQPQAGLLSEVSLGATSRDAYKVAPGDLVVIELDSFNGDRELAKKRIDYLASRGAYLLLGDQRGMGDMRAEMAEHLMANGYQQVMGANHAYQPQEYGSRYQNQRARASTLMATEPVTTRSRLAVFSVRGREIQEGAAWVNHDNERLGSISVTANLVPTSSMAGFNVPVEQLSNLSQIEAVRAHLRGMDTPEGRTFLKKLAHGKEQANGFEKDADARAKLDEEFDQAFTRLMQRFDDNPGRVLPPRGSSFGTGDIIPLVDNNGRVLLYRHGYQALRRDQIDSQADLTYGGSRDAANVAVFPSKREPAATDHTGEVVEFRPRAGYGFEVELNIPLQVFGDKKQLELNGMKYVLVPKPDSLVLPDHGFFEDWGVDMVSDLETLLGKEAVADMVDNHRNAFAFLGIDFLPDATEFFFPGQRDSLDAQRQTRSLLHAVAKRADRIPVRAADDLINSQRLGAAFSDLLPTDIRGMLGDTSWVTRLADQQPVENQITAAMLIYLMTPGARVEDVLSSGGFNNPDSTDPDMQSRKMPRIFTQVFDDAPLGSKLRTEINNRLNRQLSNPMGDGTGYVLHQDFTFETKNEDPGKNLRGFLAFPEAHSSGDNPVKNGMSFDDRARQPVSTHSAAIAFGATGAETAYAHDISKARTLAKSFSTETFQRDVLDGGAWRALTDIPKKDRSFQYWKASTPGEAMRRDLAREAVVQFRQAIIKDSDHGWDDKQKLKYDQLASDIVNQLGLLEGQKSIVDFWVRQTLGQPHGIDDSGHDLGRVTGKGAIEAAQDMLWSVEHGYLPVVGAEVPLMHLQDLQMIYRANRNKSNPWLPRESMDGRTTRVTSWDDWTKVALGTALTSDTLFDPLYLLALDGFMHTYQNATRSLMDLPVSLDALVAQDLVNEDVTQMIVSLSDPVQVQATEPVVLDAARASLADVIGGQRISGKFRSKAAPASEVAKRRAARRKWRKENGVPIPVDVTMKNFRKNGAEMIDEATTTSAFIRGLIQLRLGMALINPALYVSMGPEQWIRGALDQAANLLTGQATEGVPAKTMAKVGLSRYTPEELTKLNELYRVMGRRNDFKGMVYTSLGFQAPHGPGGMLTRGLERFGRFGTGMQDPTYGMRGDTVARRYLDAALQHIMATPTLNVISVDMLTANLMTNPAWLRDNMPETHKYAVNAVAQIRSMRETVLSQTLKGFYEPLSESSKTGRNVFGNLLFKIPLLFSNYAMNVTTTILGLQGLDQMTAMFLEGRKKGPNSFIGRIQASMRGEEFSPDADAVFDMSSVIEGIDLSRSFIRGGLTHTALFAFGMYAGGLGLGGEDEEMKRRRRLAENQGVGHIYDPRRIENDFRNADAIYLDALPFGIGNIFTPDDGSGRPLLQPHWMLKQFLSPIMGMEKFFETGDTRHITWGFQDALGSFPLINTMMWQDVVETGDLMFKDAAELAESDNPADLVESGNMLTRAVGTYERMLFENSFVNQLYIGYDRYDRNPYVLPQRDSDGVLQRDAEGNARPQNLALETFVDPETGKLRRGYMGRSMADAEAHVLAENRATFAFVSSLFTGGIGQSDYWRYNMPIKTKTQEKQKLDLDTAKALVLTAAAGGALGGTATVTADEVLPEVRNHLYQVGDQTGHFYTDAEVHKAAEQAAAAINASEGPLALSLTDEVGREHPTLEGAKAVLRGLFKGSVKFGDPSLAGVYITYEQREKIQAEWTKELVQEGLELGLDQTQAAKRMERIMYGYDVPGKEGLASFLWADEEKLSYKDTQTYAQLNTTYVIGPDGRPWATGFERDKLMQALGLMPGKRMIAPEHGGVLADGRMNIMDMTIGQNTGLRALEPMDDTRNIPTDVEIAEKLAKAIEDAAGADYTPFKKFDDKDGGGGYSGWKNYGGYGGYGGGGGGGGGAYFTKMYGLPGNVTPYGNSVPFINTSNPIIRRANVRRERVWSERGRLKQWQ